MYHKKVAEFEYSKWLEKCSYFCVKQDITDSKGVLEHGTIVKIHQVRTGRVANPENVKIDFSEVENDNELSQSDIYDMEISPDKLLSEKYFEPCEKVKVYKNKAESCYTTQMALTISTITFSFLFLIFQVLSETNKAAASLAPYMLALELTSFALVLLNLFRPLYYRRKRKQYLKEK